MKKVIMLFVALCTMGAVMAQTIVSTQVEKRNVLIEEFTGVNCQYCPDGHARANAICEQYSGHAWAINIHAGGYANGSGYTTPAGDGIHNEFYSQISGYPCGVVNRGSVQNRGEWAATAANIRTQDAIVNIAGEGTVDNATRTVTMHIEVYYTGNSAQATNYFNVAVVQDNVMGQQVGASTWYPEMVENGQYRHMHMLRDLMVGQWGRELTATQGTFFDTTIVFTVPAEINGLAVPDLDDLHFIAFVSETHRNILNAQQVFIPETTPRLTKVLATQEADCSLQYNFTATVVNNTTEEVTSVTLNVDGTEQTYSVNIPSQGSAEIELPSYTISVSGAPVQDCAGTKSVSLVSCVMGGQTVVVNGGARTADYAQFKIYTAAGPFVVRAGVDAYASEAGLQLVKQGDCSTVWSETAPYSDISTQNVQYISQLPDARFIKVTFSPTEPGLYILRATDAYGDGWSYTNNTNVSGVWLSNNDGEVFAEPWGYTNGPTFSQYDFYLNVTNSGDGSHVGIEDAAVAVDFNIYPNPVADRLNIVCSDQVREVNVIDITGRTVIGAGAETTVDVSGLSAGVYMIRVATENGIGTQKFVKE